MDRDSSESSASKAPETRENAEERDNVADPRLIPGGAEPRTPTQQGMAGLDHDAVPGGAAAGKHTTDRDPDKDVTGE